VSYDRVLNFDGEPSTKKFTLLFGTESSVFFETEVSEDEGAKLVSSSEDELELSFHMTLSGIQFIIATDFLKDSIETQTSVLRDGGPKVFLVKEKRSNIDWQIKNEFKTLSGIEVQKATGDFRGRRYVAWFAANIPVKAGPHKFNGLPGLILSVVDEKNEVLFHATSVKAPLDSVAAGTDIVAFRDDARHITLAEYVKLQSEQVEEFQKFIKSKLPRGARMEFSGKASTSGIELEYEDEAIR
jgi:GLPGLI family protein